MSFYEEPTFPATEAEAHAEWHRNAGVPMGQPGCPWDCCDPPYEPEEEVCRGCGQVLGVPEYDAKLDELYFRLDDGRAHYEPLVFTSDWLQENVMDEEDEAAVMLAMERDMHNRGLCTVCGRPNLAGIPPERFLSPGEAHSRAEAEAERAAERRMGA